MREIEAQPTPINAMPASERLACVAELERSLFELELQEEGLIMLAAQGGIDILRRSDADVRAVLNVVVVAKEAQPSAA
jgi:hypothetical protein